MVPNALAVESISCRLRVSVAGALPYGECKQFLLG